MNSTQWQPSLYGRASKHKFLSVSVIIALCRSLENNSLLYANDHLKKQDATKIVYVQKTRRHFSDKAYRIYTMDGDGKRQRYLSDGWDPAVSADGGKIAFVKTLGGHAGLCIMNADGTNEKQFTNNNLPSGHPAWSPDGKQIAFYSPSGANLSWNACDIYIVNADGSNQKRLTSQTANDQDPCFSPRGDVIAFIRGERNNGGSGRKLSNIFRMKADGTDEHPITHYDLANPHLISSFSWSPEQEKIAYECDNIIRLIDLQSGKEMELPKVFSRSGIPYYATSPAWSPDGKRIVFTSYSYDSWRGEVFGNGTVNHGLYVVDSDGSNLKQLTAKGASARWSSFLKVTSP